MIALKGKENTGEITETYNEFGILVTNAKGENYWVYANSTCANVINNDECTVFGTITGADNSGSFVYVDVKCVLVGNEQNLPQEQREKERIYDVYTEDGEAFYTLTQEELIRERYYIFRDKLQTLVYGG